LTMTEHQKPALFIVGLSAVLNIALTAVLVPHYGIEGAAIATVASTVLWNAAMWMYAKFHLQIDASVFAFISQKRSPS